MESAQPLPAVSMSVHRPSEGCPPAYHMAPPLCLATCPLLVPPSPLLPLRGIWPPATGLGPLQEACRVLLATLPGIVALQWWLHALPLASLSTEPTQSVSRSMHYYSNLDGVFLHQILHRRKNCSTNRLQEHGAHIQGYTAETWQMSPHPV